ncbi:hypothetical protein DI270_021270 [Microbispora triticiradicis]|uniref:Transcription factor zinc-finger domain-containing protein n=3 Tax=Microbispora TaxID=2005 RepID=A0ABY3LW89_9ACTN|nr:MULTISPECIES: hypothetical protein [Microbispora]RGA03020.1 hypothetical protein DI270_021270 [Microbispora triticiradicis]TLP54508.1 hypothetical protein FED44_27510 [Microbispora fusca]TYB56452.1 hypothetical protein FXF59_20135 [Microbispora tritici]GLW20697.1 hypothetical protein Mame01_07400 [Microbispora amethystogenes]
MPCYRCGARQIDPVRGASPWKRAVRREAQVLVCPDCQRVHDLDLDTCASCGSIALICRLGEIECRSCGEIRLARAGEPLVAAGSSGPPGATGSPGPSGLSGLAAEVEAALSRVLGRP